MENQNRVAKVLLLLAGFFMVLCVGMAIGGVLVYGVTRIADVRSGARAESSDLQFDEPSQPSLRQEIAPGARIEEVMPGSSAEQAGLQVGDTILAVDGQRAGLVSDLADLIAAYEPGDRVTLLIQSPGQNSRRVQVKLGEHPDRPGAPYLGVRYSSAQPKLAPQGEMLPFDPDQLPMPRGRGIQGVVVVEVTRGSPAAAAGLQPGDAITAIDGQTLNSAQALVDAIEGRRPGEQVTLNVFRARDGNERQIEVTLGEHPDQDGRAYLGVTIGGSFRFFRGPGSEGGALPPGFDFGPGSFHLEVPLDQMPFHLDQLPFDLDQLPFHLDELPGGGQEFHQEFGSEDNSL
ncbi:MAG: PDZ domain-containing protein [Anaerolineae bacterium]|jgi:membrane-associated protease RseP (regulator of RpoE activity)